LYNFRRFSSSELLAQRPGCARLLRMGGTNPYIEKPRVEKASRRFKITFVNLGKTIEVDPNGSSSGTGLSGSILDIALAAGIDIDHACGGVCACSTCHVWVKQGLSTCSPATDAENDMLDLAPDLKPSSRLSCQCVPNGQEDLVVEIPSWNRNLVREGQ
jgi:2Fe-2S ferredoxin